MMGQKVWAFEDLDYGNYGAEYLKLPRHAHNAGLGTATTAWSENLAGFQYNPSLLASNTGHYFLGSHSSMTLDRNTVGMAYHSGPLYRGFHLAFEAGGMGIKGFEGRDQNGARTENFDEQEGYLEISTAKSVKGLLDYGLRLRYLYQQFGDWKEARGDGFGLDLGLTYSLNKRLTVGASLLSLGSVLHWQTGRTDPVAPQFRSGVHYTVMPTLLDLEVNILKPWAQPLETLIGIQYTFMKIISLRGGLQNAFLWDEKGFQDNEWEHYLGIGVRASYFGVDYSFAKPGSVFGASHKVSVLLSYPLPFVDY